MPIYEFRCLDCNEVLEVLMLSSTEEVEMQCKACKSENLERILSSTNHAMAPGGGQGGSVGPSAQTRTCSSGSCSTVTLPGVD
ncbi:MAG: FmdB family zinc ribbon protein [Desulfatibacillaceae bacterium]